MVSISFLSIVKLAELEAIQKLLMLLTATAEADISFGGTEQEDISLSV